MQSLCHRVRGGSQSLTPITRPSSSITPYDPSRVLCSIWRATGQILAFSGGLLSSKSVVRHAVKLGAVPSDTLQSALTDLIRILNRIKDAHSRAIVVLSHALQRHLQTSYVIVQSEQAHNGHAQRCQRLICNGSCSFL